MAPKRCEWVGDDPLSTKYHDKEWGFPTHDERKLFEFIVLESAQAGLSWMTILRKRENYRKAFSNFDPEKVSKYTEKDVKRLLKDSGIIRNRAKIEAAIKNARGFLKVQDEFGSFDSYAWKFVGGKQKRNKWKRMSQIPAKSKESEEMSKDMKGRGFAFLGPVTCYSHMQATGLVNDHMTYCFRYNQCK
jgi:DNA-3-methyladenine glycosylase I